MPICAEGWWGDGGLPGVPAAIISTMPQFLCIGWVIDGDVCRAVGESPQALWRDVSVEADVGEEDRGLLVGLGIADEAEADAR